MIKVIFCIGNIDYDIFLDQMMQAVKDHPEQFGGAKLPPFSSKMLKMLPKDKKNEMLVQAVNTSKAQMIQQAELGLSSVIGPVKLYNIEMECPRNGQDQLTAAVEISSFSKDYIIDTVLPKYYMAQTAHQMMGESYKGSYDLGSIQHYMKEQSPKDQELLIAKSMSANKPFLIYKIEEKAESKGIELRMNNIRFMVR